MLRGEFHCANGEVIPNNITKFGAATILAAAMTAASIDFWVGLVDGVADPDLQIEDLTEPTIGTNGYGRIQIAQTALGWPTTGEVNGEPYIESDWMTWVATGGAFDQQIRRMMLVTSQLNVTGDVFALSAPLAAARTIDEATDESLRKFKYRIYLR